MAYAALISLENTIHHFLNHHLFSISLQHKQQIFSLLEHVKSFQGFLEEFPDKFNSLEGKMRKMGHEVEDSLEYLVSAKVRPSSTIRHRIKLKRLMREIYLIAETINGCSGSNNVQLEARSWARKLKSQIIDTKFYSFCKNLRHQPPGVQAGVDSSIASSSSNASAPPKIEDDMVDFEDYELHVKERLCAEESKLQVIPICGMGGIGKTTLAKKVYEDQLIKETFDIRVWITVSQVYSKEGILSSILRSLKEFNTARKEQTNEEKVHKILTCRRYLVVMDDIWSSEAWDIVRRVYPNDCNGSRVLLTTRLSDVASYPDSSSKLCEMHLMDVDQSWILFKKKVFGNEDCPSELECIGKEIARSCGGLPLAIVVIAGVVSTIRRNLASWHEIAENVKKSAEQNQIEEILSLSYLQLPQYLRPCFLYLAFFTEDEEMNVTQLIKLWMAEGFLKSPADSDSFEMVAEECLEELVRRNLVLVTKKKWDGRIKSCGLHDMMRDLCIRKAHESKFFLNLTKKKTSIKSLKNHRRVIVKSSNLSHLSSSCNSIIHSIRCWKYYHVADIEYFLRSVRLLRVLNAEPAHVEDSESIKQVSELFHLRYLAITYSGSDLTGLWNLQNLQTLIIHIGEKAVYKGKIGRELWLEGCMPQLRHVYFHGVIHFYDPEEKTYSLGSLQTVSYVSHRCCTERILKKLPNLKKLKIDCSGRPHHGETTCLNDLVHLHRLENLEVYAGFLVASWAMKYSFTFPKMLKKLMLRDLVLAWNDIAVVGSLSNLRVLKLNGCTCIGGTWETAEGEFPRLEFLLIEHCGFENWITESSHFPRLRRLLLLSCWDLNEIPKDIGDITTLELIEVNGLAKKSLVESAEEIQNEQEDLGNNTLQVIRKHEFLSDDDDSACAEDGDDARRVIDDDDYANRNAEYVDDNDEDVEELIHADEVSDDDGSVCAEDGDDARRVIDDDDYANRNAECVDDNEEDVEELIHADEVEEGLTYENDEAEESIGLF